MRDKEADAMIAAYECQLGRVRSAFDTHPAIRRLLGADLTAEERLVDRWNARRAPRLEADTLFALGPTPAVRTYQYLHEDVIAGPSPYGQLAVEYEIEM